MRDSLSELKATVDEVRLVVAPSTAPLELAAGLAATSLTTASPRKTDMKTSFTSTSPRGIDMEVKTPLLGYEGEAIAEGVRTVMPWLGSSGASFGVATPPEVLSVDHGFWSESMCYEEAILSQKTLISASRSPSSRAVVSHAHALPITIPLAALHRHEHRGGHHRFCPSRFHRATTAEQFEDMSMPEALCYTLGDLLKPDGQGDARMRRCEV